MHFGVGLGWTWLDLWVDLGLNLGCILGSSWSGSWVWSGASGRARDGTGEDEGTGKESVDKFVVLLFVLLMDGGRN